MFAGGKFDDGFSLSITKMSMLAILKAELDPLAVVQYLSIDDDGLFPFFQLLRSLPHAPKTETHGKRTADGITVLGCNKTELGVMG